MNYVMLLQFIAGRFCFYSYWLINMFVGSLDVEELSGMFRSFGISLNESEMKQMFIELDSDNSGKSTISIPYYQGMNELHGTISSMD
jgi:hypothetical protein